MLVGWLAGWLVGWLAGLLGGWLADWLIDWLVGWLAGWQAGKTPNVIVSQKCINLNAKTYRFEHISCPSYRLAGQLAGWLAGRLPAMHLGHQNASKTCTLSEKVRQKHVPLGKKSVGAGGFRGGSKTRTLKQKVCQKHVPFGKRSGPTRQKRVPSSKKCVKNTYP